MDEQEYLSLEDMRKWLEQEKADLAKATELRTKEATAFVNAYASGEITAKEAERRFQNYGERWPEALPGTHTFKGATDAELLAEINEARRPGFPDSKVERIRREKSGGSPDKGR